MSGEVRLCPHGEYAYTWSKCWPHEEATMIALPAAEFGAWRRVMLAARCWRDTVIFPNEENGSEVDLCAAVDALPSARKEGSK